MSSHRSDPRVAARAGVAGASERVTLACRALSAAANDLRVAYEQNGLAIVADAADMVGVETEHVCELAEELAKLADRLGRRHAVATAGVAE
jgi:hypothetical protein